MDIGFKRRAWEKLNGRSSVSEKFSRTATLNSSKSLAEGDREKSVSKHRASMRGCDNLLDLETDPKSPAVPLFISLSLCEQFSFLLEKSVDFFYLRGAFPSKTKVILKPAVQSGRN